MGKKIKKVSVDRPDLEDMVRDEIMNMGITDPVLSRLMNIGNLDVWKYDEDDPDTMAQVSMAPASLVRDRMTTSVDKEGNLSIHVNADWLDKTIEITEENYQWEGLPYALFGEAEKLIMRHDKRTPGKDHPQKNLFRDASQLVANESMIRYFGFDRDNVDKYIPHAKMPDGLFKPNEDGEVYKGLMQVENVFRHLCEIIPPDPPGEGDDEGEGEGEGGDGEGEGEGQGEVDSDGLDKLLKSVASSSTNQDLQDHNDKQKTASHEAGTGDSTMQKEYESRNKPRKRKWQEIIQVWSQNILKSREEASWVRNPYHMSYLLDTLDARVPASLSQEVNDKGRVSVAFFADTSGSCVEYWDRFAAAALSLPEDVFDLHLYAFDTRVYKVDRAKFKFVGGGGTYFHILTEEVDKLKETLGMYPHVFVITDGYGDMLTIDEKNRMKWNIFMTEHSTNNRIPKGCKIWQLKDYE